ncbi:TolC family protein [Tsuneonella mangrovi]|uniref:TolC family protein n=1 Tax=Tsuneonella mangrovi TaxID=1982042 RepID=UPI000BA1D911|nr:TolC family protein [Tsuneonella mangrovi]
MHRPLISLAALSAIALAQPASAQSLDETLAAAIAHSPALEAARAREDAADATVAQARAERAPSASVQGQIGWGRIDPQGFFALPADNVEPRAAQVGIELPLYTGGRVNAAIDQAKVGQQIAAIGVDAAMLDLRLQVIAAYTQAVAAKREVASYSAMAEMLQEVLRNARLMYKVGSATSTDVAQAEARLAEAQAGLAGASGNLKAAETQLEGLAGQPVSPDDALPPAPPVPASSDQAAQMAVASNPQLAQARKAAEMADAGVRSAKADRMPTIGAYAEASTVRDQFFPGYKADSASVGLRGQWKFFTGGRVGAKVSKAEADARAAAADARLAEQNVKVQAVQSYEAVQAARAMVVATEKRAAATQNALRSTQFEVKAGAKPQLALLDASREALSAQTARIRAEGNLLSAAYTLRSVTGMDSKAGS